MSYVGREVGRGLLSIPDVALFLQAHMNRILGPLLVAVGFVLLEWMRLPGFGSRLYDCTGSRLIGAGVAGALPLGAVLALAFCPVSAGLLFGGLVPLALEHRSAVWLPTLYGIGTGLPVVVFAVLVSAGIAWAGAAFQRFRRWSDGRVGSPPSS